MVSWLVWLAASSAGAQEAAEPSTGTGDEEATETAPPSAAALQTPGATASGKAPSGAVGHYQRGREHYLAGRYREALVELKLALDLDPDSANLVYNVARVNEDLGNLDDAISYFQRYLKLLPESEHAERDKTEKTVRRLQGAKEEIAEGRGDAGLKGFGPATAREPAPLGVADEWFWLTAGTGAALAIAGGITGVLALQHENDVADFVVGKDGTLSDRDDAIESTDSLALASDLFFVGSAVAVTSAALLFFLRDPEAENDDEETDDTQAFVHVDLHGARVIARGRF